MAAAFKVLVVRLVGRRRRSEVPPSAALERIAAALERIADRQELEHGYRIPGVRLTNFEDWQK